MSKDYLTNEEINFPVKPLPRLYPYEMTVRINDPFLTLDLPEPLFDYKRLLDVVRIVIPANVSVRFQITSDDVLHS
jgi:heme/copper-type cytochrome/quinol oxidase subunit 2